MPGCSSPRKFLHHFFCALFALALIATPLIAQIGGNGSIQGVISDPSGAAVPGASVTATNVATNVSTTRTTTGSGYYVLSPLPAGVYTVTVKAPGFETLNQEHVTVDALSQVGLNLTVKVGSAAQETTVTATPPALNTNDASMGTTVRNEVYDALPLAMGNAPRDPTAFTALMPGVSVNSATTGNTAGNVLGGQDHSQEIYVEGLPTTSPSAQGESRTLGLGLSVEAVDQFQLESAGTSVEYQGQGSSNYVIKSGTNTFHGAGYEYFRNTVLDARGFFAPVRPSEHQNEFGVNIGGPIKKNKLFFFANYDGFRFTQQVQPALTSIPTLAERQGNFSALPVKIYDPQSTVCSAGGVCSRTPFPGNVIPGNRISSISQYLQSFLPQPINNNLQNNFLEQVPTGYQDNSTTEKVDFNMNEKNTFSGVFSRGHRSQATPYRGNTLPLPYANTRLVDEIPTTALAKWTYVASPSLVNQLTYGLSRFNVPITDATIAGNYATKAGLTGLPVGAAASAFPQVSFSGPESPDNWRGTNSQAFNDTDNTFTLQDNVQWTHGRHSFIFGVQMQWLQANEKERTYGSLATWTFANGQTAGFNSSGAYQGSTGNAYASFLLGAVSSNSVIQDSVVGTGGRYKDFSWWVQDNIKVNSRLTLNLGLRHDIWSPYTEVANRESFFNPTAPNAAAGGHPGILEFYGNGPDSCHCATNINTDYLDLGPRLGLAFQLDDKTVMRAGYSIMYTHRGAVGGRGGGRYGLDLIGYSAQPVFSGPGNSYTPAYYWNNGVPPYQQPPFFDPTYGTGFNSTGVAPTSLNYGDPTIGGIPPRYQNWNFAIEHSFTPTLLFGTAYVGSNGHHLSGGGRGIYSDQIDPKYLALGGLLQQNVTPTILAAANKIIPGITLPYPTFSGSLSQMLRPWPQYQNISDLWGDVGNSNYNSLQVYATQRLAHGLTFHFNYTWAKAFDDTGSNQVSGQSQGTLQSAYYWANEKSVTQLPAHTINMLATYQLPFGAGRQFANGGGILSHIVGGWQLSGIGTYRSGTPIGTIMTSGCVVPNAGSCFASYNPNFTGSARTSAGWGDGNLIGSKTATFLNAAAFMTPAAYSYGNTSRTGAYGIQNPSSYSVDMNVRRDFSIYENFKLTFQVDAFNIFNFVNFSAPSTNISSSSFGKITSQSNGPRILQLSARITF